MKKKVDTKRMEVSFTSLFVKRPKNNSIKYFAIFLIIIKETDMSKFITWMVITFMVIVINSNVVAAGDKNNKFMPKPVPINLKPPSYDESYIGVGFNKITALSKWKDSWLTGGEEEVGDIEYTVNNLVIGMVTSDGFKSTTEWNLLIGTIDFEEDTKKFHYDSLPGGAQDMNVKASGDGYDIGVRVVSSRTFNRQEKSGGGKFIDWNYALSLHAAFFSTNGSFEARSVDGQWGEAYKEEELGIFLRPVISLQPILSITDLVSIVPYIGVGTTITMSGYYWENTDYVISGSSQPGQFSDGSDFYFDFSGIETMVGFDIGIITNRAKKHKLTIGGAISELMGDDGSRFQEVHVLYAIPY